MTDGTVHRYGGKVLLVGGKVALSDDCCCPTRGGAVLIWDANCLHARPTGELTAIYTAMGLTVHTSGSWSGNLADYGLVHWLEAVSDPPWWPLLVATTWHGRLHVTAEWSTPGAGGWGWQSRDYLNARAGITGVTVGADWYDIGCARLGTAEAHRLAAGCDNVRYALTASVSGGEAISKTVTGAVPWIASSKAYSPSIEFVVAGDADHATEDDCVGQPTANAAFFANLWSVGI